MKTDNRHKKIDGIVKRESSLEVTLKPVSIKSALRKSGLKLFGVFVLALLMVFSLSSVGGTISYFNDLESSIGNYLRANPLDFNVRIASSTEATVDLTFGEQLVVPEMELASSSSPVQYFVKSEYVSGDLSMCEAVGVLATFPFPFDDKLLLLQTGTTTQTGSWSLALSLPDPSLFPNTTCRVDLVYKGWNEGLPLGSGFEHTEKVSININVGSNLRLTAQSFVADLIPTSELPDESASTTETSVVDLASEDNQDEVLDSQNLEGENQNEASSAQEVEEENSNTGETPLESQNTSNPENLQ